MKRVLITGKNSYIGKSIKEHLLRDPVNYCVNAISVRENSWISESFTDQDVVIHVAALVHKSEKRENPAQYVKINRDLAEEVARTAKLNGVRHFIFLSTMAVYGLEGKIGNNVVITERTPVDPKTLYAKSKVEAEKKIIALEDSNFKVTILRPPMVYGPNCERTAFENA